MRSIICVVAGFVVIAAIVIAGTAAATELIVPGGLFDAATGSPLDLPANYYAANLVVSITAAVLGGWVTARMAPDREMLHVAALVLLVVLMGIAGILGNDPMQQGQQPVWYTWTLPIVGALGVLLGGWLRARVVVEPPA